MLSAVLRNNDIHTIYGEEPVLFQTTGDCFEFIKDYYSNYKSLPGVDVIREKFSDIDIPETSGATQYHLDELRSHFVRTQTDGLLERIAEALDKGVAPAEVVEKGVAAFTRLSRFTGNSIDINIKDTEAALEHYAAERERSLEEGVAGIPTGIDSIDANYQTGLGPGHSIIIMGYSGSYKSWLAQYFAIKAWMSGRKVMYVSLELTAEECRDRIYSVISEGRFAGSDLMRGDVDKDDFIAWAKKSLLSHPDFIIIGIDGNKEMTPNRVQAKIDQFRPEYVTLDYLQLMSDNANTKDMTPKMLNLSREVKRLAMSNGIPITSITSVTDNPDKKRVGPPSLASIAWSRAMEFDASLVLSVFKHQISGEPHDILEVLSVKNRYGSNFGFFFQLDVNRGKFVELFETPEGLRET